MRSTDECAQIENELKKAEDITCIYGEPDIANYQAYNSELRQLDKEMQSFVLASRQGLTALVPGRVVVLNTKTLPGALAVLIRTTLAVGAAAISASADGPLQRSFQFLVLTGRCMYYLPSYCCALTVFVDVRRNIETAPAAGNVGNQLVDLPISAITSITTQRLRLDVRSIWHSITYTNIILGLLGTTGQCGYRRINAAASAASRSYTGGSAPYGSDEGNEDPGYRLC